MERIKDFIYEKSDVFFASLVIIIVVGVIFYNLRGWMFIDGEMSKYHKVQASPVSDQSPVNDSDKSGATTPSSGATGSSDSSSAQTPSDKNDSQKDSSSDNSSSVSQNPSDANKPEDQKTSDPNQKPADQKSDEAQTEQKPKENTSNDTKPKDQKPADQKSDGSSATTKNISIAPGSSAGDIAAALKNSGLISDSNAFLNKVVSSGKENKLKAGTFSIPSDASVDQIIAILTK